jgi:hypothetical protein
MQAAVVYPVERDSPFGTLRPPLECADDWSAAMDALRAAGYDPEDGGTRAEVRALVLPQWRRKDATDLERALAERLGDGRVAVYIVPVARRC